MASTQFWQGDSQRTAWKTRRNSEGILKRRKQVRRLTEGELKEIRSRFFLLPTVQDAELLEAHGIEVSDYEWKMAKEFAEQHPDFEVKWN
jgi:hypothetical protein